MRSRSLFQQFSFVVGNDVVTVCWLMLISVCLYSFFRKYSGETLCGHGYSKQTKTNNDYLCMITSRVTGPAIEKNFGNFVFLLRIKVT